MVVKPGRLYEVKKVDDSGGRKRIWQVTDILKPSENGLMEAKHHYAICPVRPSIFDQTTV